MDADSPYGKYPVPAVRRGLLVPVAVKAQAVQELSAVQAFLPEWFQGRPPLHGGAGNNNSLL